jgi:hypothetical protein
MRWVGMIPVLCSVGLVVSCAPGPCETAEEKPTEMPRQVEVFPHVWLEAHCQAVLVDGWTPIAPGATNQAIVWLETVVCTRDTKEHEALVVTEAKAAHVHAALLMLGLQPGAPGSWEVDANGVYVREPPTGPTVRVEFVCEREGQEVTVDPRQWMLDATTAAPPIGEWVFAGSQLVGREGNVYAADEEGTIVGISTFGTETIAWSEVFSPETSVEEPRVYANEAALPPFGALVRVRISATTQAR